MLVDVNVGSCADTLKPHLLFNVCMDGKGQASSTCF